MSASEDIKKERSIAKGLFTRASNSVRQCVDARDDTDIIIKKLDDLDKRYANLLEKHELYKAEIQDNPDYNEAKEEEWMNDIENEYLSSERLAHSYIKETRIALKRAKDIEPASKPTTSMTEDTSTEDIKYKNTTEIEQVQTMRDYERSEFVSLTNRIKQITVKTDFDLF